MRPGARRRKQRVHAHPRAWQLLSVPLRLMSALLRPIIVVLPPSPPVFVLVMPLAWVPLMALVVLMVLVMLLRVMMLLLLLFE